MFFTPKRVWLGLKHFLSPNDCVHSELYTYTFTLTAVTVFHCTISLKDNHGEKIIKIYLT